MIKEEVSRVIIGENPEKHWATFGRYSATIKQGGRASMEIGVYSESYDTLYLELRSQLEIDRVSEECYAIDFEESVRKSLNRKQKLGLIRLVRTHNLRIISDLLGKIKSSQGKA